MTAYILSSYARQLGVVSDSNRGIKALQKVMSWFEYLNTDSDYFNRISCLCYYIMA
jgi:hypothetical protein